MRLLLVIILLAVCPNLFSQVDYNEFIKKVPLSCTKNDSASIIRSQRVLDSLNQFEITSGKETFNRHYALMYGFRYWTWYNNEDMEKSMQYYEKNWIEFKDLEALSNLRGYAVIGDCEKAIHFYELYNKELIEHNMEVDYRIGYLLYRNCWENEMILRELNSQ